MSSSQAETLRVDEARDLLIHRFSALLADGAQQVRVRINHPDSDSPQAWIYRHQNNRWVRTETAVTDPELVRAIQSVAQLLASHPPSEDWHSRRREMSDFEDTDITFHTGALQDYTGDKLESWLAGKLFRNTYGIGESQRDFQPGGKGPYGR